MAEIKDTFHEEFTHMEQEFNTAEEETTGESFSQLVIYIPQNWHENIVMATLIERKCKTEHKQDCEQGQSMIFFDKSIKCSL